MTDDFDDEKQRRKQRDGPKEMFDIFHTMGLDSKVMGGEEYHQRAGHSGIQVVRRGEEAGDQAKKVGEEDEKSQSSD